jgi:hypothetical protein
LVIGSAGQAVDSKVTVEDLSARVHSLRLADDVIAGKDLIQPADA